MLAARRMNVKDNIRDGYTPLNAPSRREVEAFRAFYNATGEPRLIVVIMTARDSGNLLRMRHLKEAVDLWSFLTHNFEIHIDGDEKPMHFDQMCEPYCFVNQPLSIFYVSRQGRRALVLRRRKVNKLKTKTLVKDVAMQRGIKIF